MVRFISQRKAAIGFLQPQPACTQNLDAPVAFHRMNLGLEAAEARTGVHLNVPNLTKRRD
jgi:hypothetical protein